MSKKLTVSLKNRFKKYIIIILGVIVLIVGVIGIIYVSLALSKNSEVTETKITTSSGGTSSGGTSSGGTSSGGTSSGGTSSGGTSIPKGTPSGIIGGENLPPVDTSLNTGIGQIGFHYYYEVSPTDPQDYLDISKRYNDELIISNFIAGILLSYMIDKQYYNQYNKSLKYNRDYLCGTMLAQLLQENTQTESYTGGDQIVRIVNGVIPAVFGSGQGGPYQINNYSVDMVTSDNFKALGFSLVNFEVLQLNIGYKLSEQTAQYGKRTPLSFNNVYFSPLLTAYFHFLDFISIQYIGSKDLNTVWSETDKSYTPDNFQPYYKNTLEKFTQYEDSPLDIVLNIAYNQGFYGAFFKDFLVECTKIPNSSNTINDFSLAKSQDTYHQYPYQVRGYLNQLYNIPSPNPKDITDMITTQNSYSVSLSYIKAIFIRVFSKCGYISSEKNYENIPVDIIDEAFSDTYSLSTIISFQNKEDRNKMYRCVTESINNLERKLGIDFTKRTMEQLIK